MNHIYWSIIETLSEQLLNDLKLIDIKNKNNLVSELTGGIFKTQTNTVENETNYDISDETSISDLALYLPRIKSSINKHSRIGSEIANHLNAYNSSLFNADQNKKAKIISYNRYRKIISHINSHNQTTMNKYSITPRIHLQLARNNKQLFNELASVPLSDAILNPVPEPVDMSTLEQMKPLYDWFHQENQKKDDDLIENLKFLKGTLTTDGRLDLCKQVIGPIGIEPLLQALGNNKKVDRLLLGNNIIGDSGGQKIAEFIKSGKSELKIWYIAGNHLTAAGIQPIAESLENNDQVEGLWLKRNPLKAAGMIPISKLLQNNYKLKVLDLFNCGLLDDGLKILCDGLSKNRTLEHLYLGANGITVKGCQVINQYFNNSFDSNLNKSNSNLKTFFIGANRIGNELNFLVFK
jgi:Ran GTPase-activating protein (RanGAP) involved in mRNA processing and transport